MSDPTTYERLSAPFDVADHAKVNKGSGTQTYAPWTAYVQRLNDVLKENWSFRVVREGFTDTECWVLGEVTAVIDGVTVTRQQYGCEPIVKGSKPVADLLKTAASDAIKKAASLLGPGLYLSIKEEREAIEAEMRAAVQAEAKRQSQPARPEPTTTDKVRAAAMVTGAPPETVQQRWQRLVAEAERAMLPTIGMVKAIDPVACGDAQLARHADRLEGRLAELKQGAA